MPRWPLASAEEIGQRFVVTFRENATDPFAPVRERLRGSGGRIRSGGASYLPYALQNGADDCDRIAGRACVARARAFGESNV